MYTVYIVSCDHSALEYYFISLPLYTFTNVSQLYTPLSETTVLLRIFINNYLLPGITAGAIISAVLTMVYCCQEEYIYLLGYSH